MKRIWIIFFISLNSLTYAQNKGTVDVNTLQNANQTIDSLTLQETVDSVNNVDTSKETVVTDLDKTKDEVKIVYMTPPSKLDTVAYGSISLTKFAKNDKVPVYLVKKPNDTLIETTINLEISSINIQIENWHITRCFVQTNMGIFQSRNPISLLYYNQSRLKSGNPRRNDNIYFKDLNGSLYCIKIGAILDFEPSSQNRVSLGDFSFSLIKSDFEKKLTAVPTADNIINFSIFTDVVGLFGEANGLVQFEADAVIPISHSNISNKNWFLLRSIRPYFDLVRMDKEFQVIDVKNDIADGRLDDSTSPKLFRQSFLRAGIDLNLYSSTSGTNNWNIFTGAEFRQTRLLLRNNDKQSASVTSTYIGANFITRAIENFRFGVDCRYYYFSQLTQTQEYKQERMNWIITSFNLSYHPPFRPESKIFLRLNYHYYSSVNGYDFTQLQFGYKTPLSKRMKSLE